MNPLGQPLSSPNPAAALQLPARPATAIVLAAGKSERIGAATQGTSKVRLRVGGLGILERTLRMIQAAGIEKAVVVVGHDADRVGRLATTAMPGRVEVVPAEGWEAGNGDSLAAAEYAVRDEGLLLLLMSDHLFGADAIEQLLCVRAPAALVDPHPSPDVLAEGTRVVVADGCAVAFGKELESATVDCGAFLVPRDIFDCQRAAAADGDHTVAGALTRLAARQPVLAVGLAGGSWWVDVDTPADLVRARGQLRRSLVKPGDGPISRLLNRQLSSRISMALAALRIAPDLVTVFVFLIAVLAALALGTSHGILGGLLAQLSSVLDGVDGELARLQFRASSRGAVLDAVLDRVADAAILTALGVWAQSSHLPTSALLVLTGAAVSGSFLSMALKDRAAALGLPPFPERTFGWLLGGRDGRLLLIAVCAILGQPVLALTAVAVTSWLAAAARLCFVWWRPASVRSEANTAVSSRQR
ncbi:MAG TPA: NTP transferase domain-containing protein [Candidatus Dormibacteraeota bacterium]|nr:NTP transferase domain-containing protein [Candidatus Dormibacteraeota bacterium]